MEHRAPRLSDLTIADITLDVFRLDKRDLLYFTHTSQELSDEAAERILNDAVDLASLVDDIVGFYRQLARDIRQLEKDASQNPKAVLHLNHLYGGRLQVFQDVDLVSQLIKKLRLGRYFPITRRRISKCMARLRSGAFFRQGAATLSASPVTTTESAPPQPESAPHAPSQPLCFTQPPGKIDSLAHTLKTLRTRYANLYKSN